MAGKKHTHKYRRISMNGTEIWACAFPDCTHYQPHHLRDNVPGKMSICWECGEEFILDAQNMKSSNPICINCSTSGVNPLMIQTIEELKILK